MTGKRRVLWLLLGVGLPLVIVVALAIFAPGYAVRYALVAYLDSQGLDVSIDRVDADLLTGHVGIDGLSGRADNGRGFVIDHLGVAVDYAPLWNHRVVIDSLTVRGARADVTRHADNRLSVAGVPIPTQRQGESDSSWQFALHRVTLGALAVHYRQAASGARPAIDQVITLNDSRAGDVITWQPGRAVPIDTHIGVAGGSLALSGHVNPLGQARGADVRLVTHDFPLSIVAPFARLAGLADVAGRMDTDQRLKIDYDPNKALTVATDGQTTFHDLKLVQTGGLTTHAKQFSWHGHSDVRLLAADDQPGRIDTDGRFTLVGLDAQQADVFELSAARANWQGKGRIDLDAPLRISTHGTYDDRKLALHAGKRLDLAADSEHLSGDIETTLDHDHTTIVSNGDYRAKALSFTVPDTLATDTAAIDWHGTTQTTLSAQATRIDTHGKLGGRALDLSVPATARFKAGDIDWRGDTHIDSGRLFVHSARGRLVAGDARLDLTGLPLAFTAGQLIYDGRYGQQPTPAGDALALELSGEAISRKMRVMDTKLDAPWLSALQTDVTGIDIDSLSRMHFDHWQTSGVRIMGDTNTSASVVDAVTLEAKQFDLTDLLHYSVDSLDLDSAIVHLRRDADGYGVISQYLATLPGAGGQSGDDASGATSASSGHSTFTVKHIGLSGPSLWFTDTTTTPHVTLHGLDMNVVMDGLDTVHPEHMANYRLSMDIGAFGHFDSQGDIAPFAPGGMNMDLSAWLRSLAMPPLSGYLDQAMGRKIGRGVIDGTLDVKAKQGQLDGTLDATIGNFRLDTTDGKTTEIAYGVNMETALALVRGEDDEFHFQTKILGDVTSPSFSVNNLVREAVLAGLRTALLSNYSPVGLANKARNAVLNLFRSVEGRPATFKPGKHYVQPKDRHYLGLIAQAMDKHIDWRLTVQGQATPADAKAMSLFQDKAHESENQVKLSELASEREEAVRDYLAARGVSPDRIVGRPPQTSDDDDATPLVRFTLDKHPDD